MLLVGGGELIKGEGECIAWHDTLYSLHDREMSVRTPRTEYKQSDGFDTWPEYRE